MKRRELIRKLESGGCRLLRRGGRHDLYVNPTTGKMQPVPRHTEIDEALTRHILRYLSVLSE
jgi:predicted RNA binding protein YcfA (HicA-like mRNA interferase family)